MRLFVPDDLACGLTVELPPQAAHRLLHVMRRKPGDTLALFNGRDGEWAARISAAGKNRCALEVAERLRPQLPTPDVWLAFAALKRDALDLLVEKATELGAAALAPVFTRRTVAERVNLERMRATAVAAAEQCGRLTTPDVRAPRPLADLMGAWPAERHLMFCDEAGEAPPVLAALAGASPGPWAVLVGPEGGFAPEERRMLRALPFTIPVSLGPRILRAETAAVAALTLWQAALGDLR
jgi:16S rRNA (uracil1498-N3)-methyltransferase